MNNRSLSPSPTPDAPGTPAQERRQRPDLRAVFEAIIHRLEPFFNKAAGLNGNTTEYWAARVILESHPDLTHHEAKILVDAAARYYRERERTGGH